MYKKILNAFVLRDAYSSTLNKSICVEVEYLQWVSSCLYILHYQNLQYVVLYHNRPFAVERSLQKTCEVFACTADLVIQLDELIDMSVINTKRKDCCWAMKSRCSLDVSQGTREFRKNIKEPWPWLNKGFYIYF